MTVCPNCGGENPEGSRFCLQCGTPLGQTCPNCGASLPGSARFCNVCGTLMEGRGPGLAAAPPATTSGPIQPSTERRLVSVLFADLVGFTALSESRDSEEVRELLSRYFDVCRTVISRYRGTVEKFIGDAVMAVWGTPVAQEDDPERSVRAALDLVEAVAGLGASVDAPGLRARAGVLTGEATVSLAARDEGMVAGDLVNTASRIQSVAEPGRVYVGEATRRATESAIAYEDAGTHELKGKAEPARLYRALRVVAGIGGSLKSEGLEAPFVGRDRELRMVKDLFHATCDERKAHLVSIVGIAGIGKSRLSWEFYKYIDGLAEPYRWHRGRCLAYGEGVAYWALAEMVRGRAEILEGEETSSAQAKLHSTIERYVPEAEEQRWVEPRLAQLLGLEERPVGEKEDLFAGWRLFFERMAEDRPVIMSFEDCQWADASLLEFIEYLLEWSRSHPIFVLAMARPELLDRRSGWGTGRSATSVYLEPLSAEAMRELLEGLVPGLPADATANILARAEGVPLYAVETVRMLLDRGLLIEEGSSYRLTQPIESLEVPETLHALIAARLDGLTPKERRLIQDASVLGKTFTRNAIAALSGFGQQELDALLASLVRKEVLGIQADPRSPERGQYGFLQDLVRAVAYEGLAKRDRRSKHLEAASHIEEAWGEQEDEIVEVLASHYLEAYRLAPDTADADVVKERARLLLARAGERAASLAAAEEAQGYFRQASELAESPLQRAELTEWAGQMSFTRGQVEDAVASYHEATHLFEEAGQGHQAARVQARLAEVEFFQGHVELAVERMAKAHTVLSGDEPDPDLALVAAQLGRFLALSGRHREAGPPLEEALELSEHLELSELYSQALTSKGLGLTFSGRLREASMLQRQALEVALQSGFTGAAFRAYANLGVVLEAQDRFAEAVDLCNESLVLARRTGHRVFELNSLTFPIVNLVRLGRWNEALHLADEAQGAQELSSLQWAAGSLLNLVPVYLHRGALQEARDLVDTFAELRTSHYFENRAIYILAHAELLRAEGKAAEALDQALEVVGMRANFGLSFSHVKVGLVEAVEAALDLGDTAQADELLGIIRAARPGEVSPYLRAHGARLAARLAALRNEQDAVEPGFVASEQGFRELQVPFDLAVTLLEHAEWLIPGGRPDEAGPLLAEAAEIFERLGAKPWIERTSRTRSPLPLVREG